MTATAVSNGQDAPSAESRDLELMIDELTASLQRSTAGDSADAVAELYEKAAKLAVARLRAADQEAAKILQDARQRADESDNRAAAQDEATTVQFRARNTALGVLDQVQQFQDQLTLLVEWGQALGRNLEQMVDQLEATTHDRRNGDSREPATVPEPPAGLGEPPKPPSDLEPTPAPGHGLRLL